MHLAFVLLCHGTLSLPAIAGEQQQLCSKAPDGYMFNKHVVFAGMGFVTNYCLHPGLQALLAFSSRREALTPIGAVEVLGDFDLAAGPHV